jgi:drug/metabolite transporter (DMT)-like permease
VLTANAAAAATADRTSRLLGTALTAFSAITFGVGTTFGRFAFDGGSNPLSMVLLRILVFAVVVGAVVATLRRPARLSRAAFLHTLWMAATLMMVSLGYMGSVVFIPVSLAAVIFYTFPLLVGVIAAATGRERMTTPKAAALMAAFAGLALALGAGFESLDWRGVACVTTAALGMAITVTFSGEAMRGQDTLVMNVYTNLWMLIGLAAYIAAVGGFALPETRLGAVGALGVCISYVIAFVTWFLASRLVSPVRLAALFNIEPLVTIFAAWLLLDERLAPVQLVGAALVLGSIFAVTLSVRRGPLTQAEAPGRLPL